MRLKMPVHRLLHWRFAVRMQDGRGKYSGLYSGQVLPYFRIHPEQEMLTKQFSIARLSREVGCGNFVKIEDYARFQVFTSG